MKRKRVNKQSLSLLLTLVFIVLSMVIGTPLVCATESGVYNFNGLSTGLLNGQDNWVVIPTDNSGADRTYQVLQPGVTIPLNGGANNLSVTGHDGTNAARFPFEGPAYNCRASRVNDANFSLPAFNTDDIYVIEFEMAHNYWGSSFGLGYDANGDKDLADTEMGVNLTIANKDTVRRLTRPDGFTVSDTSTVLGSFNRYQIIIDQLANSGAGSASVWFLNLDTAGNTWQPITGLQNINMGFDTGTGKNNPLNWNGMQLYNSSAGPVNLFDNIIVRRIAPSARSVTFNDTATGSSSLQTITLDGENLSGGLKASLTGDFVFADDTTQIQNVTKGSSLTFKFIPTMTGTREGTLILQGDEMAAPLAISLSGKGLSEAVAGAATDLDSSDLTFQGTDTTAAVTQDFTLPDSGSNGTTITWAEKTDTGNNISVSGNTVTVTPPVYGQGDKTVTLTATITKDAETTTKDITVTIKELAAVPFYVGNAIRYADSNDTLYTTTPLTTQLDNITMEAWVKPDTLSSSGTYIRIMYNGNSGTGGYGIYLAGASKTPCILLGGINFLNPTETVTLNTSEWCHLAAVRDSGVWKLYINGAEKTLTNNTLGSNAISPSDTFSIGNSNYAGENFTGCFDEVRFWTVARTAQQINDNMYIKLNGDEPGLLSYYNFDQVGILPGGDNTAVTTVTDVAGGDQNLSISGFALSGETSNFVSSVQLGQFQFENASYDVTESAGSVKVAVTRTGGSEGGVTLNYSTQDGTAAAGTNYITTSGSLTFASGETRKEIDIPVINNGIMETKSFTITLNAAQGVSMGTNSSATINIVPALVTYTISGNAGVSGATLSYTDGTDKAATADADGAYSLTVSYNWSGTVTPGKTGYTFNPVNKTYSNVTADQTEQNYTAVLNDAESVAGAATGLDSSTFTFESGDTAAAVTQDFTVPMSGSNGTTITWAEKIDPGNNISVSGSTVTVTRPANGQGDQTVTLTATIAKGTDTTTKDITVTIKELAASNGSSHNRSGENPSSTPISSNGAIVTVNGNTENLGTETTSQNGNQTVTVVNVDQEKLAEKLEAEGSNITLIISANTDSDLVVGELNGQIVKDLENKQAVVEVKTETAAYTLPAQQINISDVSNQIGQDVKLSDIKVNIEIAKTSDQTVKVVEDEATKGNFSIVVPPVDFTVKCTYGGKTVNVSQFNSYVERTITIPDGVDPNRITTGVVIEPDGTLSPVPTKIVVIDGKYYAKINSLTNSTYSVIWHPVEFKDVANHWAKEAANDMGSRLVMDGTGEGEFAPDNTVTRAEFTEIIVRALGLMRNGTGKDIFSDVSKEDQHYDAVSIAYKYGIISGYGNHKFGPTDRITREQSITMIAGAMSITGFKSELENIEADELLESFADTSKMTNYAKDSIAICKKIGIVNGKSGKLLAPKASLTRAEAAVLVRRLLQKSGLI